MLKKNIERNNFFLCVIILLSIVSIFLYIQFAYQDDFITGKTKSFMWRWQHTNDFKIEHGLWLMPMGLMITSLLIWLLPNVEPFDSFFIAKNYIKWKFREGKKEYIMYFRDRRINKYIHRK